MVGVEMHFRGEFSRQALHRLVVRATGEIDFNDAIFLGRSRQAREELSAKPVAAKGPLDAERRFGMAALPRREGVRSLKGAQFRGAAQFAVDEGAKDRVAGLEAMIGVAFEEIVRGAAVKAVVAAFRVEAKEMGAE